MTDHHREREGEKKKKAKVTMPERVQIEPELPMPAPAPVPEVAGGDVTGDGIADGGAGDNEGAGDKGAGDDGVRMPHAVVGWRARAHPPARSPARLGPTNRRSVRSWAGLQLGGQRIVPGLHAHVAGQAR